MPRTKLMYQSASAPASDFISPAQAWGTLANLVSRNHCVILSPFGSVWALLGFPSLAFSCFFFQTLIWSSMGLLWCSRDCLCGVILTTPYILFGPWWACSVNHDAWFCSMLFFDLPIPCLQYLYIRLHFWEKAYAAYHMKQNKACAPESVLSQRQYVEGNPETPQLKTKKERQHFLKSPFFERNHANGRTFCSYMHKLRTLCKGCFPDNTCMVLLRVSCLA